MKFDLRKFLEVVASVGPVVIAAIPGGQKIAPIVPKVIEAIGEAEKIRGASGAAKKAHVLNVVRSSVDVANATGRVKLNPAEVEKIASESIDTVIATVHVIEGAKVDKTGGAGAGVAPAGGVEHGTASARTMAAAGLVAPGAIPGVDTAPRGSDLPGGHATHGHGSSDDRPKAGTTRAAAAGVTGAAEPAGGPVNEGNRPSDNPPPTEEFEGANRPPSTPPPPVTPPTE